MELLHSAGETHFQIRSAFCRWTLSNKGDCFSISVTLSINFSFKVYCKTSCQIFVRLGTLMEDIEMSMDHGEFFLRINFFEFWGIFETPVSYFLFP